MQKNQHGFSIVELVIIVVVVGAFGGAGWYVSSRTRSSVEQTDTAQQKAAEAEEDAISSSKVNLKTFEDSAYGFSFDYPENLLLQEHTEANRLTIDVKSPGTTFHEEGYGGIKDGFEVLFSASSISFSQENNYYNSIQSILDGTYVCKGEFSQQRALNINALKAVEYYYSYEGPKPLVVQIDHDTYLFQFTLTGMYNDEPNVKNIETFRAIVNSFKLIDRS